MHGVHRVRMDQGPQQLIFIWCRCQADISWCRARHYSHNAHKCKCSCRKSECKAQNCSTGSVTLKIRKSAWIMLDMLDLHPCVSSLVLMMMVAFMLKDVLAVIAVVIIMVTVLTLLPPLRASCRHNKTCKNRKNRCSRMVLVLALICLKFLRQLHHDPNNKGLERHCLRPEVSRTLLGWSHCCIFGVSESKHQDWKWLEQNQLRCSWIFYVFFWMLGVFFSLAWLPLIAMTQNGKVDKVCFLFAPTRQRVVVLFDIWSLSKKAPILFCLQFAVCCVDLCIDVCICTCNDFAMYLSRIYTYMAHMAVYRWVMGTNTK